MKYFAKYLPVEGEIKEGDKFFAWDTLQSRLAVLADKNSPAPIKIAKLFLCSRDIQVGDKVRASGCVRRDKQLDGHPVEIYGYRYDAAKEITLKVPKQGANKDLWSIEEDDTLVTDSSIVKLIGEISPDAIWVKEGDEFEEDNLRIQVDFKRPDSDYPWLKTDMYNLHHLNEELILQEDDIFVSKDTIQVRCHTCKNFH
jgi:hypothetical protein